MKHSRLTPYLFVLPFLVAFTAFFLGPILVSLYAGFTSWRVGGGMEYVGLANYAQLLHDRLFWIALRNTLVFAFVYNLLMIPSAFVLALALNSPKVLGVRLFRMLFFSPITASLVALVIIFDLILHREYGLLNLSLRTLHVPLAADWLRDTRLALGSIVGMRMWRLTGYYMTILLAGLQTIPESLHDAAKVDGAGFLALTRSITIPLLRPVLAFVFVMSTIFSLQLFDEPWLLNQGGPNYATLTVVIHLYRNAFGFHKLGYGSAIAFVLSVLMFAVSLVQLKIARIGEEQ